MSDLETLVEEFAQTFSNGVGFAGTVTEVENLLSGVMTEEQFAEVLADAPVREEPIWERVATLRPETLRGYLGKEHPQTVAFILSQGRFGACRERHRHVCRRGPQQPAVPDDRHQGRRGGRVKGLGGRAP